MHPLMMVNPACNLYMEIVTFQPGNCRWISELQSVELWTGRERAIKRHGRGKGAPTPKHNKLLSLGLQTYQIVIFRGRSKLAAGKAAGERFQTHGQEKLPANKRGFVVTRAG